MSEPLSITAILAKIKAGDTMNFGFNEWTVFYRHNDIIELAKQTDDLDELKKKIGQDENLKNFKFVALAPTWTTVEELVLAASEEDENWTALEAWLYSLPELSLYGLEDPDAGKNF